MPYDPNDPRSQLSTATPPASAGVPRAARYRELRHVAEDDLAARGTHTWWTRSQAVVVGYSQACVGDRLDAVGVGGEYAVLVLDTARVVVTHGAERVVVDQPSLVIVPAGDSSVEVTGFGIVIRLFAAVTAANLAAQCSNAADYDAADPNVADFAPWPDPPDGWRVRAYPIAEYPIVAGRLGRIFRCTTLMINVLPEDDQPRDPTKLSPHHHDDFEQISLQVHGDYVHHMRVPWIPDSTVWRDDEHRHCDPPAVVVIPPGLVHTSEAVGSMRHWLIDVFAPPRVDFSERDGWVRNADEYPMR